MLIEIQGDCYMIYLNNFSKLSESSNDNFCGYTSINEDDYSCAWEETRSFRLCYKGGS